MADEQQTLDQQTPEQSTGAAEDLTACVQELEKQLAATQDQALHMITDLQNVRRRAEQDVEKAHKFVLEKFAGDLLAVVDTLERGLKISDPSDEAIKPMRGRMELTLEMFGDTLRRYQVEALNPRSEPFSPEQHQVMAMQESASAELGSVLKVFQKGCLLNGRLLRPAMVVVSKAPAETPSSIDEQA